MAHLNAGAPQRSKVDGEAPLMRLDLSGLGMTLRPPPPARRWPSRFVRPYSGGRA